MTNYLEADAVLSPCRAYRYLLTRSWEPSRAPEDVCVFLMLNPSTADHREDDRTLLRCVGFARDWGYRGVALVNLFAFRATNPARLRLAADPVGPGNDDQIVRACANRMVVCAWGATVATERRPVLRERAGIVKRLLMADGRAQLRHLGLTKDGHPKHPLYLPTTAAPAEF